MERLTRKRPEFSDALKRAFEEAKFARENFHDNTDWVSGWGHNFCCPKCAAHMIFDVKMEYNPPHTYKCSNCGTEASSKKHDEAWVYYYRSRMGGYLPSCAAAALFGDKDSLDFIIKYVDFYADNYHKYPVHGEYAGKGRVMNQGLDEAVWAIEIISALRVCGDLIPEEKKAVWMEKFFRPMTELLIPQANKIHNIPTWLICCVGVIGIYFKDNELLDLALNGEFGIRNQVAKGFTADGIWYEGSMTYHYYTTKALTHFFAFYAELAPEDKIFDSFAKMYTTPLLLAHDGYRVPAINDGWYPVAASFPLVASRMCEDQSLVKFMERVVSETPRVLAGVSALLYSLCEEEVEVLSDTRLAVVKTPFHVLFKSGVIATSHMHSDYLSIRIAPFSDDLGTPGYGHPLTPSWYRRVTSHNAIAVDGEQPYWTLIPSVMERVDGGARGTLEPGAWRDLAKAERTVTVEGDTVRDISVFEAATEHTYDWFFHSRGNAVYSCDAKERIESLDGGDGYQHFEDICRMATNGSFTASFTLDNGETLTLAVPSTDGIEVYVAKSPDNPADKKRNTVILRRRATSASFAVEFTRK